MGVLRLSVASETQVSLVQKLRRHGDVVLRRTQVDVTEVCCQLRQQMLHILTRLIPCYEAVLGCRVPQIVQAWLVMRITFTMDARLFAQTTKGFLGHYPMPTRTGSRRAKECRVPPGRRGQPLNPLTRVVRECAGQFGSSRNPSHFEKLCVAHSDQPIRQVDIVQCERQGFVEPHPGSIQQEQQRPIRQRSQGSCGRVQHLRRRQQALEFIGRINVRCPSRWKLRYRYWYRRACSMASTHCVTIEAA